MEESVNKALLPDGLRDGLPPDAGQEADLHNLLLRTFASRGYERVEPPLVEFEDSLLDRAGDEVALSTFRLMDPVSQRMMGVRADMTPQVARIATTRLHKVPRPLRLSYGGFVLRVRGNQIQPDREFRQAGVELIGADESTADCEVILLAYDALCAVGVQRLSVDLTLPTVVPGVCDAFRVDEATRRTIRAALDRKDAAAVAAIGGEIAADLGTLLGAAGPADKAMAVLDTLSLPPRSTKERDRLRAVVTTLRRDAPDLNISIDPVENRGFAYHSGLSFTFFADGVRGELGCGGRYRAGDADEPATGFSLFLHNLLRAVTPPAPPPRLLVPLDARDAVEKFRADGWITVSTLSAVSDMRKEADRLGCTHCLVDGEVVAVDAKEKNI